MMDEQPTWKLILIWFILHVLQPLPLKVMQQNLHCISKSTMEHQQNYGLKIEPPLIQVMIIGKCILIPPNICVHC